MFKEKKTKNKRTSKKITVRQKSINVVIKKIVLIVYAVIQLYINNSITLMLTIHTDGGKSLIMHY